MTPSVARSFSVRTRIQPLVAESIMPVAPIESLHPTASVSQVSRPAPNHWIFGQGWDQALLLATPILVTPLIWMLQSPLLGIQIETIALVVTSFGALGHHFPGMIRAYGDRELFERFRMRFLLAPVFLFAIFFPLYLYERSAMQLIVLIWACWHGLMQVYGFVRIYDARVGSTSQVTAYWDWLMCLTWFSTAQLFSRGKLSGILERFYAMGGPLIPPAGVNAFRWFCLGVSFCVLIGFTINYVIQVRRGPAPNPAKLFMLASGIGFWWFTMVSVDNLILGVAMFEVFHDLQYLAIVWMYNCRRVSSSTNLNSFMRFVFRRNMVVLYVGMVLAYGLIGFVPRSVENESIKTFFTGILWTSTILHYYYDGFIWKVREKSTRANLGLNDRDSTARPQKNWGEFVHVLKWSPLVLLIGWLFVADSSGSPLTIDQRNQLSEKYAQQLQAVTQPPANDHERSWLFGEFERVQNIAAAVPDDHGAQLHAGIMLANFGRKDEAIQLLDRMVKRVPRSREGYMALGEVHQQKAELEKAFENYQHALDNSQTGPDRAIVCHKMGEVLATQNQVGEARRRFQEAISLDPQLTIARAALETLDAATSNSQ